MKDAVRKIVAEHTDAGRRFHAGGIESFALDRGEGEAVLLLHGVPSSSYLYRKVAPGLAADGLRAVAPDFPGLGLADRPDRFDYSWGGLAGWLEQAVDALALDRCHLVVHDIGGPIGFEWAIRNPDRVRSLTVLNTLIDVASFRRPWSMHPFSIRGVGEVWLKSLRPFPMSELLYLQTIGDRAAVPREQLYAYYELLKREDGGRAFLRIMRGFELTDEKQAFYHHGLTERHYPAQIVWGEQDRALGSQLRPLKTVLGIDQPQLLAASHFLQEDRAVEVARAIAQFAQAAPR